MRCKHKNKTVRCWSNYADPKQWYHSFKPLPNERHRRRYFDALVCDDCGHWLPLGPATDNEQTAIEVQLASLLAETGTLWEPKDQDEAFEDVVRAFVRYAAIHDHDVAATDGLEMG